MLVIVAPCCSIDAFMSLMITLRVRFPGHSNSPWCSLPLLNCLWSARMSPRRARYLFYDVHEPSKTWGPKTKDNIKTSSAPNIIWNYFQAECTQWVVYFMWTKKPPVSLSFPPFLHPFLLPPSSSPQLSPLSPSRPPLSYHERLHITLVFSFKLHVAELNSTLQINL